MLAKMFLTCRLSLSLVTPAIGTITDSYLTRRWEKDLVKEDVSLLLRYRKEKLPDFEKRAQELNQIASQAIVDGLIAYGWKYFELAAIDNVLMNQVQKYVNLHQFALDQLSDNPTSPRSRCKRRHDDEIEQHGYKQVRCDEERNRLPTVMLLNNAVSESTPSSNSMNAKSDQQLGASISSGSSDNRNSCLGPSMDPEDSSGNFVEQAVDSTIGLTDSRMNSAINYSENATEYSAIRRERGGVGQKTEPSAPESASADQGPDLPLRLVGTLNTRIPCYDNATTLTKDLDSPPLAADELQNRRVELMGYTSTRQTSTESFGSGWGVTQNQDTLQTSADASHVDPPREPLQFLTGIATMQSGGSRDQPFISYLCR